MQIHLPDEIRNALEQNPGEPVYILDDQSQKHYVLLEATPPPEVLPDHFRLAIEEGLRAVEEGRVLDWDLEETKRRCHERLAKRDQA